MPYLLERLAGRPTDLGGRAEDFDVQAAIGAQIQRIVYSRNAPGPLIAWGLTNITQLGSHDTAALTAYAGQLRQAILTHEPRLRDVSVAVLPQPDALTPAMLEISGMLSDSDACCRFSFAMDE